MRRFLLLSLLLLAACRPAPAAPLPTAAPTAAVPTIVIPATALPGATATTAVSATATTSPAGQTTPADRCRLPGDACFAVGLLDPAADVVSGAPVYHIAIEIAGSLDALSGRQTVTYTNRSGVALDEIYFHLHPNLLDGRITVSDVTVDGAAVETQTSGDNDGLLRLALPSPLAPDVETTIEMAFDVKIATEIGRNYGVLAYFDNILALAHFYPMLSVYDAGGWNTTEAHIQGDLTFSEAGYYQVQVTAPEQLTLVASGVATDGPTTTAEGTQTATYAVGPARDFYLAAGDFITVSETVDGTTINSYAPAAFKDGAALALEVAAATLRQNNARLSPYPYTELDIVTTPTAALGIEYPGVIVGTLRMYDIEATTAGGFPYRDYLESTTAHEVNHQWFYNLVGNDQLDQPWLDESVTGYNTYRYYAERYGQETGDAYFENFFNRWAGVDEADIPIGLAVADYADDEYVPIVYGRGAVFVRRLEETMGRATFDAFLSDYTARQRWQIATTADFRALAESHCGCDLGPLFAEWVYE